MNAYIIVEARTAQELATLVNERIREGYAPVGGVAVKVTYLEFFQAMVWRGKR